MSHTKEELEGIKKPNLIKMIIKMEKEGGLKSDSDLEEQLTAAKKEIAMLKGRLKKDANYSAYGQDGLTKEEYEKVLRDKSM